MEYDMLQDNGILMIHSDSWLITIWLDIKWEFQYQFVVYIKIEFIIKLISMKE